MAVKLANNAVSRLSGNITNSETTISLVPGEGARFPTVIAPDWFPLTLVNTSGGMEIVKATARSGDVITVERAQENTTALPFNAGDRVELRVTAGVFQTFTDETLAALAEQGAQLSSLLPPGTGPIPWSLPTEPPGWIFADGRTLGVATPYTALRTAYIDAGFPFGQDGGGNPRIPDMRGRVPAGRDNMGGAAANRLTAAGLGVASTTLGNSGGGETHTLTTAQMPGHTHTASSGSNGAHTHTASSGAAGGHAHTGSTGSAGDHSHTVPTTMDSGGSDPGSRAASNTNSGFSTINTGNAGAHSHTVSINSVADHSHTVSVTSAGAHTHTVTVDSAGSGGAHPNVQPSLICNYIVKV
jgi:microcystin-dependent protein